MQATYKMQVGPNLRESLYMAHIMPWWLSSKALGCGHAQQYWTHAQAAQGSKKRK